MTPSAYMQHKFNFIAQIKLVQSKVLIQNSQGNVDKNNYSPRVVIKCQINKLMYECMYMYVF